MEIEPLEVFSRASNAAIIKPPGRKSPGCVIQGDSLAELCLKAKNIAACVQNGDVSNEDLREDVQELANCLISRMLQYQEVLRQHNIDLPHAARFSESDFVNLGPPTAANS